MRDDGLPLKGSANCLSLAGIGYINFNQSVFLISPIVNVLSDELADQKMSTQQAEEGFQGTLLTSNISSEVV